MTPSDSILSARLHLTEFRLSDCREVFNCITPEITRFLDWDAIETYALYFAKCEQRTRSPTRGELRFVVRKRATSECLGLVGFENIGQANVMIGIWLKAAAHGKGYGGEAIRMAVEWAYIHCGVKNLIYPVAVENTASRRIAEGLGGTITEKMKRPKYDAVVYTIPTRRNLT